MCFSLSKNSTRVTLSIALEALAPVATSNDDYDILHQIEYHDIPCGEGCLRPDIVIYSQRILSSEPLKPSVQTSFSVCGPFLPPDTQICPSGAPWCARSVVGDICGRERQARPTARQDAKT